MKSETPCVSVVDYAVRVEMPQRLSAETRRSPPRVERRVRSVRSVTRDPHGGTGVAGDGRHPETRYALAVELIAQLGPAAHPAGGEVSWAPPPIGRPRATHAHPGGAAPAT